MPVAEKPRSLKNQRKLSPITKEPSPPSRELEALRRAGKVQALECEPLEHGDRRGYRRITGEGSYAELLPPAIRSEYVVTPGSFATFAPRRLVGMIMVA